MENEQLIDLTGKEFQGCYGHDVVAALKEPGFYRLPLRDYNKEEEFWAQWDKYARAAGWPTNENDTLKIGNTPELEELEKKVKEQMAVDGFTEYAIVDVHIDKVLFVRGGTMQLIHTSDKDVFKEDNWAYYNGNEQLWKYAICTEEIMDELSEEGKTYEEIQELIGDVCELPSKEEYEDSDWEDED